MSSVSGLSSTDTTE